MKQYQPRFQPRPYQKTALERLKNQESFALLMAMRTGKTKTLLDDYGRLELAGQCHDLIVVAPGGVYETWGGACREHLSDDLFKRAYIHVWKGGNTVTEEKYLDDIKNYKGPRIFIVNIEAVGRVRRLQDFIIELLQDQRRKVMCAVDESTIIKNERSAQTKFMLSISHLFRYRRILSGLVTPRSPLDLFSQFYFLNPRILGFRSYYAFRARFCILKKVNFTPLDPTDPTGERHMGKDTTIVVAHHDSEELHARVDHASFRVTLEAAAPHLPPKIYMRREVPLTSEQRRIYTEMTHFANSALDSMSHVTAVNVISQLLKLHQILLGHVKDETGVEREIPEKRTEELLKLLDDYDGKAIIWCSYHIDIIKIAKALREEYDDDSVAEFWGGNKITREADEVRFKTDPKCRFMVATASAGGRGRTWDVADMLIYYSNSDNLEHRMQSEERAESVNRVNSTLIVDLGVTGTVEDKIIKSMREKINMSTVINGDNYKQWLI